MSLKSKVFKGTATSPTLPLPLFADWVLPTHALSSSAVGLSLATTANSLSPNGISPSTTLLLALWQASEESACFLLTFFCDELASVSIFHS